MEISRQSLSVGIFTCLLQYFPKNRAIFVQKLWGEKKLSKPVFGYFKTKKKKIRWPLSSRGEGGVKALMAWPLVEDFFFFAASLTVSVIHFFSIVVISYANSSNDTNTYRYVHIFIIFYSFNQHIQNIYS